MRLWQRNPEIFIYDCFGLILDPWQQDVVELYHKHPRTGLIASKGPGKTFVMSMCTWHFFLTKHRPKIAALSVTESNLKTNLWAELLMVRAKSDLAQKSTKSGGSTIPLIGHEGYSFITARSYPKSANEKEQASALAGVHADNVMFVIDEAGTIPDAVFVTADAALTTGQVADEKSSKIMATANPERPTGVLYRASKGQEDGWQIYHVSGDPEDPKRAPRVDLKWASDLIKKHGRDHPYVMVNVLAQYPSTAVDALLTDDEVFEAMNRDIDEKEVRNAQVRLGVDVARGGIDDTVLFKRKGLKAYPPETLPSTMLGPEVSSKVVYKYDTERIERVYVDDTGGYGSSVIDNLSFHPTLETIPIKYNAKAQDSRYFNKRTEMWVRMRDWVKKGGQLPNDTDLAAQLVAPKLFFHNGKTRLEEKQMIKDRIGKSPDKADALAQTFADIEEAGFYATYGPKGEQTAAEYGHAHQRRGNMHISDERQLHQNTRENDSRHLV